MRRKKPPKIIAPILAEVKSALQEIYGDNLRKVILYGSYARGDYDVINSDVDVLIVLRELEDFADEIDRFYDDIWNLNLKYEILISTIPCKEKDLIVSGQPFYRNVRREGIIL
jgi:predicted nucleotidyltransferase